jgi:hypothetical protein
MDDIGKFTGFRHGQICLSGNMSKFLSFTHEINDPFTEVEDAHNRTNTSLGVRANTYFVSLNTQGAFKTPLNADWGFRYVAVFIRFQRGPESTGSLSGDH